MEQSPNFQKINTKPMRGERSKPIDPEYKKTQEGGPNLTSVKGMPESFYTSPEIKSVIAKYYKTSKPDKIVLEVERKDGFVRVFTLHLPQDIIAVPAPLITELFPGFNEKGIDVMYSVIGGALKKEFSLP